MLSSSLREKADVLFRFAQDNQTDAKWVDRKDGFYVIHVAPFDPAEIARRMLWNNFKGYILISTTLASIDDFNSIVAWPAGRNHHEETDVTVGLLALIHVYPETQP